MGQQQSRLTPIEISILTAPFQLASAKWTSDDVAKAIGASQSSVARTWRRLFDTSRSTFSFPKQVTLNAVQMAGSEFLLVAQILEATSLDHSLFAAQLMRSPRRAAIQTLLAAPLLRNIESTQIDLSGLTQQFEANKQYLLITNCELPDLLTNAYQVIRVDLKELQSLLVPLIQISHQTSAGNLRQLHHELITWAHSNQQEFSWHASTELDSRTKVSAGGRNSPLSIPQVIADQSFEWIVARIWSGELTAGDRITETGLAKGLHTTRNQSIDALRTLASAGLIDHHDVRGYLVPKPTKEDIAEVYAARRLIGTEILKRIIADPKLDIQPIKESLDRLLTLAKTGNSYETGTEDMLLQNALAEISGLRNYPQIFATLAKQLRMYIAVLGLSYFYPIAGMVSDDTAIYRNIRERNITGALAAWNKKIDDSLNYMTARAIEFK